MIVRVSGNGTELSQRLKPVSFSPFATTVCQKTETNKKDKYLQWRWVTNEVFNCLTPQTDETGTHPTASRAPSTQLTASDCQQCKACTGLSRWAWPEYFAGLEHFFFPAGKISNNIAWVRNKTYRIWMLKVYPKLVTVCPHEPHETFGMSQKLVIAW